VSVPAPVHHPPRHKSIDQLDGAVVPDLQPLGERTDGGRAPSLQSFELQQQRVLLGLDPRRPGRVLASTEKTAQLIPQIGEPRVIDAARACACHASQSIAGRYKDCNSGCATERHVTCLFDRSAEDT
jgi:hypothetical protein